MAALYDRVHGGPVVIHGRGSFSGEFEMVVEIDFEPSPDDAVGNALVTALRDFYHDRLQKRLAAGPLAPFGGA